MQYLCNVADVGDAEAKGFELDGQSVLVANHDAQLRVYVNWCPHLGIELNFMPDQFLDADNAMIMCANHGALFEIDSGHCLSGPCSGDALMAVPHEVRGDEVWAGPVPEQG